MTAATRTIHRFFMGIARDKSRVFGSGIAALVLWYLIGQKVLETRDFNLPIHAVGPLDREPEGDGLIVRVPQHLAFVVAAPPSVTVSVTGPAEDLARLESRLRGSFDVPPEFCGTDSERTVRFDVTRAFSFPRMNSIPSLDFAKPVDVELTCARRAERAVTLNKDNLEFDPASTRADVDVEFEPAFVSVSGPADEVTRLEKEPSRLKLATVNKEFVTAASSGKRGLPVDIAWLVGSNGIIGAGASGGPGSATRTGEVGRTGLVVNGGKPVQVTFHRRRVEHTVVLDNVEIAPLIPAAAWREGANRADPVHLKEKTARVTLRLPESDFTNEFGGDDMQVRRQLALFVNLRDLVPPKVADRLKVRDEGLPEGATIVSIVPDTVDVEWNLSDSGTHPPEKQ